MNKNDTTLYAVYWSGHDVLKIGVTNTAHRVRKHQRTGALLLDTIEHATTKQERAALDLIGAAFDRAFPDALAAVPLLGHHGLGFTECFIVPERHLRGAHELFKLGVIRGVDEAN